MTRTIHKKIANKIKFICQCFADYFGNDCKFSSNPCVTNICRNNGTCIYHNYNQTYSCECFSNNNNSTLFYGKNCENKIDICLNETCSSNGICYDDGFNSKCKCFYLYSGDKCQIESTELKFIKIFISISSIIAIIVLALTYFTFLFCDISKIFCKNKRRQSQNAQKKITKFKYIN